MYPDYNEILYTTYQLGYLMNSIWVQLFCNTHFGFFVCQMLNSIEFICLQFFDVKVVLRGLGSGDVLLLFAVWSARLTHFVIKLLITSEPIDKKTLTISEYCCYKCWTKLNSTNDIIKFSRSSSWYQLKPNRLLCHPDPQFGIHVSKLIYLVGL